MERIYLDKSSSGAVDGYLEYRRIVGDDDGGKLFTQEQYEEYKKRVLPQRTRNRLYVSFGVPGGMDCQLIGPETKCFCTHRYKQHKTDFDVVPPERPLALPCQVRGCRCLAYHYVPLRGSDPVRCRCKHAAQDHSEASGHLCKKCTSCSGFLSPYTCGCGQPSSAHRTLVETRVEREARGRPVGRDVPYAAMGGLTGFSSLLHGYLRLDDSGTGAAPLPVLSPEQSGSFQPHVFEKAYGPRSPPHKTDAVPSVRQDVSDLKLKEEEDMAYFERRYQERLRAEKASTRQRVSILETNRISSKPICSAPRNMLLRK